MYLRFPAGAILYFSSVKKHLYPILHVLAWAILLSGDIYDYVHTPREYLTGSIEASGLPIALYYPALSLCYLLVPLAGFYGFYFFVGPAVFVLRKPVKAIAVVVAMLAAMVLIRFLMEYGIVLPLLKMDNYRGHTPEVWWYIQNCIGYSYKSCLFGLIVYFIMASQKAERERKEIEREKIQAELSFLRSQVNPHFLFNTINDIYALTYQKSDLAPDALLKLSGILRYMLYEGNRESVSLVKELEYMQDYIALQRIGLKDQLYLDVKVEGEAGNMQVASLLLIPFFENIFKHGVLDNPQHPAILHIHIAPGKLSLQSSNLVKKQQKDSVHGIGLQNVERRLQLLYAGRHIFEAKLQQDSFICSLELQAN